jgi:hypothetical protein
MARARQKPGKPSRRAITRRRNAAKRLRRASPLGRLTTDGACSPQQIKRRLLWLAIEWQLDAPPKVGLSPSEELTDYCRRHGISFDWMLYGDLKGLQRMMNWRLGRAAAAAPASLRDKLASLSESEREIILRMVEELGK